MLFADSTLVRRIEYAACQFTTDVAAAIQARDADRPVFVATIGGGTAVHIGNASPFNKMIGIGLDGPFEQNSEMMLAAIEHEFAERHTSLQAEVSTLADSSVVGRLSGRGYTLVGFENVLGLRLDERLDTRFLTMQSPVGLTTVTMGEPDEKIWQDAVISGFATPDIVPGGESHESFSREALEQAMTEMASASGFTRYLMRIDGTVAGGASLRISEGVAQLCGSATLPLQRRRGVQTALLARRLLDAQHSGCDLAVITTQPGSKSQQNAQKYGFALLYSRAILVWEQTSKIRG